jgi:putative phosphoesterase
MMRLAVEQLRAAGTEYFIHCGDVGSEQVLDCLAGLPSCFVFGNCDWDRAALQRYAESIGVACFGSIARMELAGRRIVVMHGDDAALKRQFIESQEADYLFQGHTHIPADERVGQMRLINPGALHRAARKTVAVLDLANDSLERLTIPGTRAQTHRRA